MTSARTGICAFTLLFFLPQYAKVPNLPSLWETGSTFKTLKSVLYSAEEGILYVSNIDGEPNEKLKRFISKLSVDGKNVMRQWTVKPRAEED